MNTLLRLLGFVVRGLLRLLGLRPGPAPQLPPPPPSPLALPEHAVPPEGFSYPREMRETPPTYGPVLVAFGLAVGMIGLVSGGFLALIPGVLIVLWGGLLWAFAGLKEPA